MNLSSIMLAVLFLQLQIWGARSQNDTLVTPKISCQVCGPGVGPNYGCDLQTIFSEDAEVTDGCTHCGIWEEWGLNSDDQWRMLVRRRICLIGERQVGCIYWYPAGTRGNVHEICKCIQLTCNRFKLTPKRGMPNTNITTLMGKGHPSKFPPQNRSGKVVLKVINGANSQVNGVLHLVNFLVPLLLLSYKLLIIFRF